MPSLTVVTGPNEGDYYPLGQRTMVIGRDEGCPIQIVDELVSRKHVQVRRGNAAGEYVAVDMKSANGMFVNGRRIDTELTLQDGDLIELGKSKVMFSVKDFDNRESAMAHYKQRGQRFKNTLQQ